MNRMLRPAQYLHYRRYFRAEKPGYWHFSFDITSYVQEGENLLQVVVRDLTDTSHHAMGKQSLERGGMWYTPQSGIFWIISRPA